MSPVRSYLGMSLNVSLLGRRVLVCQVLDTACDLEEVMQLEVQCDEEREKQKEWAWYEPIWPGHCTLRHTP